MAALRPDLLVLEYTEIWPNLIRAAHRAGVRIALTNGRFDPDKLSRYRAFFRVVGNPLAAIDCFLMRSDEEAERALQLGAAPDRVWVTGNTKFDALVLDRPRGARRRCAPRWGSIAGRRSSWPAPPTRARRSSSLEVYRRLVERHPGLQLVVAPRYVERAGKIMALAAGGRARRPGCAAPGPRPGRARSWSSTPSASWRPPTGWPRWSSWAAASSPAAGRTSSSRRRRGSRSSSARTWRTSRTRAGAAGARRPPGGDAGAAPQGGRRAPLPPRPDPAELGALAREAVTAVRGASARNVDHMLRAIPRPKGAP